MAQRGSMIVIGAGLASAALLLVVARRDVGSPAQLEAVVADFDAQLRETAAAAQARAVTLAEMPRLAWAVATDEATVRNLTGEELAFRPQLNETIEIGQIDRRSSKEMTLLRSPAGAKVRAPLNAPGMHILVVDEQLQLTAVVSVEPKVRADTIRGAVAVSRQVDLNRIEKRVRDLGLALRYQCAAGHTLAIGISTKDQRSLEIPLTNQAAKGGKLWAMVPEQSSHGGPLTGAAVLVLVGSFVWAGLLFRRARPLVVAPSVIEPTPPIATRQPVAVANTRASAWPGTPPTAASPAPVAPAEDDDLPLPELVPESRNDPVPASVIMRLTPPRDASAIPPTPPKPRKTKP